LPHGTAFHSDAKDALEQPCQLSCGAGAPAAGSSRPCWRGVGLLTPRTWLCGATPLPERTRCTRGSGTSVVSFSTSSTGERVMPVVPSAQGCINV
jgi:hypothetical protein